MSRGRRASEMYPGQINLISGRNYPELSQEIANNLEVELGEVALGEFANGEIKCQIGTSVRDNDVFVLQTHYGDIHQAIMEQLLIIDAAKRASARSITAVCPFLSYSRQDRKASGREPIAARLLIDMLCVAGADRITSVDLHSGQTQGFFDGPFDHLTAMPILKNYLKENFDDSIVIVSPDAGRTKLIERYSRSLNCDMALIHKERSTSVKNKSEAKQLVGEVKGKVCVLVDDMIDTAGTICQAADLLKKEGAQAVYGLATHGLLSGPAYERINNSSFERVVVTNTVPVDTDKSDKIEVLSVAPLIASAIEAITTGESVSALFEGQNQI